MEYEIEDRPGKGDDGEYGHAVMRNEFAFGRAQPRPLRADHDDRALAIPEQEAGS